MRKIQRLAAVAALAGLTAVLGACGEAEEATQDVATDAGGTGDTGATEQTAGAGAPTAGADSTAAAGSGVTTAQQVYGPACGQVPTEGEGSVQGMIDDPVGTAASNNPLLTTLTQALMRAELVDTLNNPQASFTVFAPSNAAFDKLPPGTLDQLSQQELTNILTYHVVPTRYTAEQLAQMDAVMTLQGDKLQIMGDEVGSLTIDQSEQASVLCGNIPTANATVFVIDTVLMPSGGAGAPASPAPSN